MISYKKIKLSDIKLGDKIMLCLNRDYVNSTTYLPEIIVEHLLGYFYEGVVKNENNKLKCGNYILGEKFDHLWDYYLVK